MVMQRLQEAASQGRQAKHAPGTSPTPPPVPLGVAGSVTLKDFEVSCFLKCAPIYVEALSVCKACARPFECPAGLCLFSVLAWCFTTSVALVCAAWKIL